VIEVLLALALIGGATGIGHHALHLVGSPRCDRAETTVFSFALGMGTLMMLTLALGMLGGLYRPLIAVVVGLWCLAGWRLLWLRGASYLAGLRTLRLDRRSPYLWLGGLACLTMALHLVRALAPPHGATDPLAYQLALPRLYLIAHHLGFEPTITGALYPSNMGLLYTVALALRNGILAQVLHLSLACAVCAAVFAAGRRYLSWQSGVFAAAVFSSMPVIVVFAPQGYVDVGLCFFQFVALWAVGNWARSPDRRALVLAALLAGLAAGIKHQGLATLVVGVLVLAWRRLVVDRDIRGALVDVMLYTGIAFLLLGPWYGRAFYYSGNPVWPLANGWFHGFPFGAQPTVMSGVGASTSGTWWHLMIPPASWFHTYARSMNPWYWTFEPAGWQKAIGVYFVALLPGVLLLLGRRVVLYLSLFCVGYYIFLVRLLHMNPRYGLVLFAVASLLCGLVAHRLAGSSWRPVRVLFLSGFLLTVCLNLVWAYALASPYLSVAANAEGREMFLARTEANYRLFRFVNDNTPKDAKILLQGIVKGFYCERDYIWDHPHQAVLRYDAARGNEHLLRQLRHLEITHVARMIRIPQGRVAMGYPQYFTDAFHEAFRQHHLKLVYRDESFVLFEVVYPGRES
jgi:hypothetical protein